MAIFPQPLHQRLGGMNKLFPLFFIDNHGNLFFNPSALTTAFTGLRFAFR
jgi:hypothetical protein